MGPFVAIKCIGAIVYHLDLLQCAALRVVHSVFHVLLLLSWLSCDVHANVLPIEIDGGAEYKVAEIKDYCEQQSEM